MSTLPDQARWIETFVCEECGASRAAAATPQERRPCRFCGAGPEGPRADAPGRELEPALQEVARGARIAMLRLQTHQGWGEPVYRALGLLLGILLGLSITHTLWDSTLGPGLALTLGLSAWLLISGAYGIALHRVARWAAARRTRRRHTELELEAMQRRCPGCGIPLEAPAGAAFFECARCREPLIATP
ncbi:MAG: hypothetical protein OEY14_10115, partial [Myxococcales bacterium]|nr:hypothetical protein [Myxococcales bacterium]